MKMIHEAAEHIPKFLLGNSDRLGTQNLGFGFSKCHEEMGLWPNSPTA